MPRSSRAITVSDHTGSGGARRISVTYQLVDGDPVMEDLHIGIQLLVDEARAALAEPDVVEPVPPVDPEYPEGEPEPDPVGPEDEPGEPEGEPEDPPDETD